MQVSDLTPQVGPPKASGSPAPPAPPANAPSEAPAAVMDGGYFEEPESALPDLNGGVSPAQQASDQTFSNTLPSMRLVPGVPGLLLRNEASQVTCVSPLTKEIIPGKLMSAPQAINPNHVATGVNMTKQGGGNGSLFIPQEERSVSCADAVLVKTPGGNGFENIATWNESQRVGPKVLEKPDEHPKVVIDRTVMNLEYTTSGEEAARRADKAQKGVSMAAKAGVMYGVPGGSIAVATSDVIDDVRQHTLAPEHTTSDLVFGTIGKIAVRAATLGRTSPGHVNSEIEKGRARRARETDVPRPQPAPVAPDPASSSADASITEP